MSVLTSQLVVSDVTAVHPVMKTTKDAAQDAATTSPPFSFEELLEKDFFVSQTELLERGEVTWKYNSPSVIRKIVENRPAKPREDNIEEIVRKLRGNRKPPTPSPPKSPPRHVVPPPEVEPVPQPRSILRIRRQRRLLRRRAKGDKDHNAVIRSVRESLENRMRQEGMLEESGLLKNELKNESKESNSEIANQPGEGNSSKEVGAEEEYNWSDDDLFMDAGLLMEAYEAEATMQSSPVSRRERARSMLPAHLSGKRLFHDMESPTKPESDELDDSSLLLAAINFDSLDCHGEESEPAGCQNSKPEISDSPSQDSGVIPPTWARGKSPLGDEGGQRFGSLHQQGAGNGDVAKRLPATTSSRNAATKTNTPLRGSHGARMSMALSPGITEDLLLQIAEPDEAFEMEATQGFPNACSNKTTASTLPRPSVSAVQTSNVSSTASSTQSRYSFKKLGSVISSTVSSGPRKAGPVAGTLSRPAGRATNSISDPAAHGPKTGARSAVNTSSLKTEGRMRSHPNSIQAKPTLVKPGLSLTSCAVDKKMRDHLKLAGDTLGGDLSSSGVLRRSEISSRSPPFLCKVRRRDPLSLVEGRNGSVPACSKTVSRQNPAGRCLGGASGCSGSAGVVSASGKSAGKGAGVAVSSTQEPGGSGLVSNGALPAGCGTSLCVNETTGLEDHSDVESFLKDDAMYESQLSAMIDEIEASASQPKTTMPSVHSKVTVPNVQPKTTVPSVQPKMTVPNVHPKTLVPNVQPKTIVPNVQPKTTVQNVQPKMTVPNVHPKTVPNVQPKTTVQNVQPKTVPNVQPKTVPSIQPKSGRCSQEEIERKRQEALKKRQNSKLKLKH